jgi:hypothetical protein
MKAPQNFSFLKYLPNDKAAHLRNLKQKGKKVNVLEDIMNEINNKTIEILQINEKLLFILKSTLFCQLY